MPREKQQHLKQRKDGRYCAVYKGKQFMSYDEKEALAMRKAYKDAVEGGDYVEEPTTVFEYAYDWLPVHKASVATNTYNAYKNYLNKLVSKVGAMPMKDVMPSDIKDVYNLFLGQSASTIRKARMLYVDMWDCAIEDRVVKFNPCRSKGARPHDGTEGTHRALTKEEDRLILECPADLRLAVLLMRYAGLRRGEVMAFNIDDNVDFERDIVSVKTAIHFEGNKGIESDPKTDAGKREIPLLKILEKELKDKHGMICPMKQITAMTSSSWRSMWNHYKMQLEAYINGCPQRRWFHKTKEWIREHPAEWKEYQRRYRKDPNDAEAYRMREWKKVTIRPHDLRHSYCTMLRDAGVDIKLAILWMGHADEKMILRIYDHPPEDRVQRTVKNLNRRVVHMQNDMQNKTSAPAKLDK